MLSIEEMKNKLKVALTKKRFIHSVNVMDTSIELAERYGEDKEKAALAGLLHDCAKDIRGEKLTIACQKYGIKQDNITSVYPELLHGAIGARIARTEYGVEDEKILRAIKYHTTGCTDMSLLDKIIFIADYIEPNRSFQGVEEARRLAFKDLDRSVILSLDNVIRHILSRDGIIHPDTILARNDMILKRIKYMQG